MLEKMPTQVAAINCWQWCREG